ncbi:MAG: hypothetical protein NZM31_10720 [Gemmatales bacterium]|nr:hypothetical protein [Gemmatales bacterium]MDW8387469.1 hypothetical protein [Gemmatales bacterium]
MEFFPETINNWIRTGFLEYAPPGGFSVGYVIMGKSVATIYLYDAGYEWIRPGPDSKEVLEQFEAAKAELRVVAAGNPGCALIRHHGDEVIRLSADPKASQANMATYEVRFEDGSGYLTQLFLTATTNLLVKVRLTIDCMDEALMQDIGHLLAWVDVLARTFRAAAAEKTSMN